MLDWLKGILGEVYTKEIEEKVEAEIGKGFVARADFNAKNEELKQAKEMNKTHGTQLEGLKAAAGTAEITPARAGSIKTGYFAMFESKDHPRACGEHFQQVLMNWMILGSPPRVRGALIVEILIIML